MLHINGPSDHRHVETNIAPRVHLTSCLAASQACRRSKAEVHTLLFRKKTLRCAPTCLSWTFWTHGARPRHWQALLSHNLTTQVKTTKRKGLHLSAVRCKSRGTWNIRRKIRANCASTKLTADSEQASGISSARPRSLHHGRRWRKSDVSRAPRARSCLRRCWRKHWRGPGGRPAIDQLNLCERKVYADVEECGQTMHRVGCGGTDGRCIMWELHCRCPYTREQREVSLPAQMAFGLRRTFFESMKTKELFNERFASLNLISIFRKRRLNPRRPCKTSPTSHTPCVLACVRAWHR